MGPPLTNPLKLLHPFLALELAKGLGSRSSTPIHILPCMCTSDAGPHAEDGVQYLVSED